MNRESTVDATWNDGLPGWNDVVTARAYESFNQRHTRYREANRALVEHAGITPGQRILDFAAGTGLTTEAALPYVAETDRVVCVEPAAAMRSEGERRLHSPRIHWTDALPRDPGAFDRVLCGAAIWQFDPFEDVLRRLVDVLAAEGALCFNIPAAYLGEPDEPGAGRDPYLAELPAMLAADTEQRTAEQVSLRSGTEIDELLGTLGLAIERWSMRSRFTQPAYRDWLKIPVIGNGLLAHVSPGDRATVIDRAYERVDAESWRWEAWRGWTAWRPA